jgi:predicted aldo/keto reductase-like oxidoreductase
MTIEEAMHFVWSLPVSVLITGSETAAMMKEKIEIARSFSKMSEDQRNILVDKVRDIALTGKVEYFKKQEG